MSNPESALQASGAASEEELILDIQELCRVTGSEDPAVVTAATATLRAIAKEVPKVGRTIDAVGGREFVIPITSQEEKERALGALDALNISPWEDNGLLIVEHPTDLRKLELAAIIPPKVAPIRIDSIRTAPGDYAFPFATGRSVKEHLEEARKQGSKRAKTPDELSVEPGLDNELKEIVNRFDQGLSSEDETAFRTSSEVLPSLKLFPQQYVWQKGALIEKMTGRVIDADARTALLRSAKEGDTSAMTALVRIHTGLVLTILMRVREKFHGEMDDLFQEGMMGLMNAIKRYDEARAAFTTFAGIHIQSRMRNYAAMHALPIERSRGVLNQVVAVRNADRAATREDGSIDPERTLTELKKYPKGPRAHTPEQFDRLRHTLLLTAIFDPISEETDLSSAIHAQTVKEATDLPKAVTDNELSEILAEILLTLSPQEKKVLELRYGIGLDDNDHGYKEIGEIFGRTRERVRQIEAGALRHLRHPSRSRVLRWFLDNPEDY